MSNLEITVSLHNQYCVEVENASKKLMTFIKSKISFNLMNTTEYKIKSDAHPFLQCFDENTGYYLIEFWTDDLGKIQKYVTFLNNQIIERKIQ